MPYSTRKTLGGGETVRADVVAASNPHFRGNEVQHEADPERGAEKFIWRQSSKRTCRNCDDSRNAAIYGSPTSAG